MSADAIARDDLAAVERGDIVRVCGGLNRLIGHVFDALPCGLALRLINGRGKHFRWSNPRAPLT